MNQSMNQKMKERTALGEAILKHWREHCPQMVKDLEKSRRLNRAVSCAQERTGDLLYELTVVQKMDYQAAWELAMEEWALPEQKSEAKGAKRKAARRKAKTQIQESGQSKSKAPRRTKRPRTRRGTSE